MLQKAGGKGGGGNSFYRWVGVAYRGRGYHVVKRGEGEGADVEKWERASHPFLLLKKRNARAEGENTEQYIDRIPAVGSLLYEHLLGGGRTPCG